MSEDTNRNAAAESLDELRALARDIDELALALTHGEKMGGFTMALRLDTFSDQIRQALGEMPRMGEKMADFERRHGVLNEAWAAAIAAGFAAAPEKEMGGALKHCGYEAEEYENGDFIMGLTTPYEGATIKALLFRRDTSGRYWKFRCQVENNRGTGWKIDGSIYDCGRYVAKSVLRHMALELRRAYTHRGQKIHKRAIARAMAKAEAGDGRRKNGEAQDTGR